MSDLLHQNTFAERRCGAPLGAVRLRLLAVLESGVVGSFECLAQEAGVAANEARYTLQNMRREGLVQPQSSLRAGAGAGRPRTVFARASGGEVFDSLADLQRIWR